MKTMCKKSSEWDRTQTKKTRSNDCKPRRSTGSAGYDHFKATAADFNDDWSEDSDENWLPQEYLGNPFSALFWD